MFQRATQLVTPGAGAHPGGAEQDPHAWPDPGPPGAGGRHPDAVDRSTSEAAGTAAPPGRGAPPRPGRGDAPAAGDAARDGRPARGGRAGRRRPRRHQRPPATRRAATRRRTGPQPGQPARARRAPGSVERDVPNGLRVAAAWSWRAIVVLARCTWCCAPPGTSTVVVVPVIVALLLAALLQPGAAALRRRGLAVRRWPASAMLVVGLGVVAGIITLVVEEFAAGYDDLAARVDEGLGQIQDLATRTFPVTDGQISDAIDSIGKAVVDNQGILTSGALTTAATVGEVLTGLLLTLFTLFFFLKDGRQVWLWVIGLAPVNSQAYVDEAAQRSWRTLISYVRATVGVAVFDAVFIGVGLLFLGTPLVVPLAAWSSSAPSSRSSGRSWPAPCPCWSPWWRSVRCGR